MPLALNTRVAHQQTMGVAFELKEHHGMHLAIWVGGKEQEQERRRSYCSVVADRTAQWLQIAGDCGLANGDE